jgi:hypothetical protein
MTPLMGIYLILVSALVMIAACEILAHRNDKIVIHNNVDGAMSCAVCNMHAHSAPTEKEACTDVKYLEDLTINRVDISPQGYHIACLVGLPREDDGQRIAMEGVLVTQGRELKGAYRLRELITGSVKTISMAGEGADEDTLLRYLYPKVVDEL